MPGPPESVAAFQDSVAEPVVTLDAAKPLGTLGTAPLPPLLLLLLLLLLELLLELVLELVLELPVPVGEPLLPPPPPQAVTANNSSNALRLRWGKCDHQSNDFAAL